MIQRHEMMRRMLAACPSFEPRWRAFLAEWSGEPDPPVYLALGELARHVISMLAAQELSALKGVFDVVERWHLDGDPLVREAATIGFLEGLQNEALHTTTTPAQFEPFLLPESRKAWAELNRFWMGSQ